VSPDIAAFVAWAIQDKIQGLVILFTGITKQKSSLENIIIPGSQ
jgi:hypothetical protein